MTKTLQINLIQQQKKVPMNRNNSPHFIIPIQYHINSKCNIFHVAIFQSLHRAVEEYRCLMSRRLVQYFGPTPRHSIGTTPLHHAILFSAHLCSARLLIEVSRGLVARRDRSAVVHSWLHFYKNKLFALYTFTAKYFFTVIPLRLPTYHLSIIFLKRILIRISCKCM